MRVWFEVLAADIARRAVVAICDPANEPLRGGGGGGGGGGVDGAIHAVGPDLLAERHSLSGQIVKPSALAVPGSRANITPGRCHASASRRRPHGP